MSPLTMVHDAPVASTERTAADFAELYQALAEVLSEPPRWLAAAGSRWPLTASLRALAPVSPAAARAHRRLAVIAAASAAERAARYRNLFTGKGRPRFWMHESSYGSGQLFGPEARAVASCYRAAGLEVNGSELPDHAAVELAFLAYLARREAEAGQERRAWRRVAAMFVKQHAGRWLPQLGRALAAMGDEVYGPIGEFLAAWLEELERRPVRARPATQIPVLAAERCTLCGFCVQRCPTRALTIKENSAETVLLLTASRCTGCRRCVALCDPEALHMAASAGPNEDARQQILKRSPRAPCRGCGEPMVSEAELAFVGSQLGHPHWLAYCLRCRAHLTER